MYRYAHWYSLSALLSSQATCIKRTRCQIRPNFSYAIYFAIIVVIIICTHQWHYVAKNWVRKSYWEHFKYDPHSGDHYQGLSSRPPSKFYSTSIQVASSASERKNVLRQLQANLQRSFRAVQNSLTCNDAKFFICDLGNGGVGFGARVHQIIFCHFLSYSLKRILILRNAYLDGLERYNIVMDQKRSAYRCSFNQYKEINVQNHSLYSNNNTFDNTNPLLSYRHTWKPKSGLFPPYLPGSVPSKIAKVLDKYNIRPDLWYIGQAVHFLIGRLRPRFKRYLTLQNKNFNLTSPYVGVHIRHGDKVKKESKFIPAVDYIKLAEAYFDEYHPDVAIRKIYIATDDHVAVKRLRTAYPKGYHFISRTDVAEEAKLTSHRGIYNVTTMQGLLSDIFILAQSNYIVCTLSSNIGRLVHELRQAMFLSKNDQLPQYKQLVSMDKDWYYNGPGFYHQGSRWQYAVSLVDKPYKIIKDQYYTRLVKNKWYRVKASSIAEKYTYYKMMDRSLGFVLAENVFIFPLRTEIADHLLENYVDKLLLKLPTQ